MNKVQINRILTELIPIGKPTRFWKQVRHPGDSPVNILREATTAVSRNPYDVEALRQKLGCEIVMKKFKDAVKTASSLKNLCDDPDDLNNIAICLANEGKYFEARKLLINAKNNSENDSHYSKYCYNKALIDAILGNIEEGKEEFKEAKNLGHFDPFNPFDEMSDEPFPDDEETIDTKSDIFFNPDDDNPPRCRSCGGSKIRFGLEEGTNKRYWQCSDCGRASFNPAKYDPTIAVPAPHNDPLYTLPQSEESEFLHSTTPLRCPNAECGSTQIIPHLIGFECARCGTKGPLTVFENATSRQSIPKKSKNPISNESKICKNCGFKGKFIIGRYVNFVSKLIWLLLIIILIKLSFVIATDMGFNIKEGLVTLICIVSAFILTTIGHSIIAINYNCPSCQRTYNRFQFSKLPSSI